MSFQQIIMKQIRLLEKKRYNNFSISTATLVPLVFIPLLLLTAATGGKYVTMVIFMCLPILVSHFKFIAEKRQSRSKFFFVWAIATLFFIFVCLEFLIVPLMIISPLENLIFYSLILIILTYIRKIKRNAADSFEKRNDQCRNTYSSDHYCSVCSHKVSDKFTHCGTCHLCVYERSHHNVWFNCCINKDNKKQFIIMMVCLIVWLLYTSYLILTTVCSVTLFHNSILYPANCDHAYDNMRSALCFCAAIYSFMVAASALVSLIHELCRI